MKRSATVLGLSILFIGYWSFATVSYADDATTAGTATAQAPSATWIAVVTPFAGDDDRDGWTRFELGLAAVGPFDLATVTLPGTPEWRANTFGGLTSDMDYYIRVTFVDPDGVNGTNPQIVGPIHTQASAPANVALGATTSEVRDTEIFVSIPIADDANGNSSGVVEVSTDPGGPWTEKCGSSSANRLPYHPKRCRIRSLIPGTDYWVRLTISDPDGVVGTNPQLLGPLTYTGLENLARGRPVTSDPGWGCCPNPAELVDGRIQARDWFYGFAWTGGTTGYAGGAPGWKQATIDLGFSTAFNRMEVWLHDSSSPPTDWQVETSDDGASWTPAYSTSDPQCRGASERLDGPSWGLPGCSQGAFFAPTTARYVRYRFDDRTLFGGLHGWGVELEVFADAEMDILGGSPLTPIVDGDPTPSIPDGTDFGTAEILTGTADRTFRIDNSGVANLNLTLPVSIGGPHAGDFSVTVPPAALVDPASSTTFSVRFAPSAAGLRSATISITNHDANENPYNFAMQGTATEAPTPVSSLSGRGLAVLLAVFLIVISYALWRSRTSTGGLSA